MTGMGPLAAPTAGQPVIEASSPSRRPWAEDLIGEAAEPPIVGAA